ncbi:glycosyltransferase family 4 protein [Pseudanabaena yagii]|uniref:Glycosyltransferase family 1 protein n=1 Tax=Pseudanabaena yagii GIHE-NHR1 TaxID=2722753 RepID=A0ABX1LNN8_9CYAN|nr:glycosyltransferase family 1 protein [Pseudanabaena yagii]NMF57738.1 glycosyltransferase family 1 protein [Pseudanabaena yagii GIHE-NHR1]
MSLSPLISPLNSSPNSLNSGFISIPSATTTIPLSRNSISNTKPFPKSLKTTHRPSTHRQAIALISDHGDPAAVIGKEEAGGQNVYVRQVGEALAKLGWQVDLFTRKRHPDEPMIVQHSPHCRTIRLKAGAETHIPRDRLFPEMPAFVEAFLKFQAKEGTNYPLIHTNYWMSAWVGLQLKQRMNVQLVHTYHSLGAVKYQSVSDRPAIADTRLAIERQILEQGDCVVATSPQEVEHLRSLVSSKGMIEVIPCGTDIQTFHLMPKEEARAKLGLPHDEQVVLYVGRFDPRKGIETLVRAFAQLKESDNSQKLRLLIVGGSDPDAVDGQERSRIEALVRDCGLGAVTQFVGQVGHDRLPLYYTAADVCVIPSHYEPFGLVAIEAMACGTPVVASDVGGLKFTVVQGETGWLVPPQNVGAFAEAISFALNDPLAVTKMREQASLRVQQNFSWNGVAIQLSDLYRRLLARSLSHKSFMPSSPFIPAPASLAVAEMAKAS